MEPPMTVKELSDYLRLDRMTIYKMLKEGSIPASRIGHQWRFFRDDIDKWIRSLRIGQRTSVLVVEGEPDVGQLFETELSSDNFDVIVVPTGDEAVALASKRQFDLVFLELKKSTIEAFRQLRIADSSVPVVVAANTSDSKFVDQAMDIGTFTLVKKPRSADDLRSILDSLPAKKNLVT